MNKIRIDNDQVVECNLDATAEIITNNKSDDYCVNAVKLIVHKDTDLDIEYDVKEETKLDFFINIKNPSFSTHMAEQEGSVRRERFSGKAV